MDYIAQFFKMLNIKPFEEFEITGQRDRTYRFTNNLNLEYINNKNIWVPSAIPLENIIRGKYGNDKECSIIKTFIPQNNNTI